MKVRVKLFATLTRLLPGTRAGVPFAMDLADWSTIEDLASILKVPEGEVRIVFVNGIVQPQSYVLREGDEVGLFPPIGGGSAEPASYPVVRSAR